jgi:hypothetical protein
VYNYYNFAVGKPTIPSTGQLITPEHKSISFLHSDDCAFSDWNKEQESKKFFGGDFQLSKLRNFKRLDDVIRNDVKETLSGLVEILSLN